MAVYALYSPTNILVAYWRSKILLAYTDNTFIHITYYTLVFKIIFTNKKLSIDTQMWFLYIYDLEMCLWFYESIYNICIITQINYNYKFLILFFY